MLCLSRKVREEIIIGGNIRVVIEELTPSQVRVCIDAPPDISIDRREVFEKKHPEIVLPKRPTPIAKPKGPINVSGRLKRGGE
jgi:carbon storage regulator CsrA